MPVGAMWMYRGKLADVRRPPALAHLQDILLNLERDGGQVKVYRGNFPWIRNFVVLQASRMREAASFYTRITSGDDMTING